MVIWWLQLLGAVYVLFGFTGVPWKVATARTAVAAALWLCLALVLWFAGFAMIMAGGGAA